MGLLRGRKDEPAGRRFRMREKLLSIGDDFWIEDEDGNRAYRVDGKAARLRETILLKDASGQEVAKIQERKLSVRDKMAIERDGETVATVHKALVGIRDRFSVLFLSSIASSSDQTTNILFSTAPITGFNARVSMIPSLKLIVSLKLAPPSRLRLYNISPESLSHTTKTLFLDTATAGCSES